MPITLNISAMSCWAPNAANPAAWSDWFNQNIEPSGDTPPDLAHIKPMQRRRLSLVARAVFHVGNNCLVNTTPEQEKAQNQTACVFATTYGQAIATEKMLQTIAEEKPLSPAAFSLSVHNAIAGQFSIAHGLTGPSMTIASGREGIGGVLTQAAGLLSDANHHQVLACCFEAPLPQALRPYTPNPPTPLAAAFLLQRPNTGQPVLSMARHPGPVDNGSSPLWSQLLRFVTFLFEGSEELSIESNGLTYAWTRGVQVSGDG